MKNPSKDRGLSSVDNALRLLQLVQQRQAVRVADAADELGVARSTAHRLLGALRARGFVDQDRPNGVYRPGSALRELGWAALGQRDIRVAAGPTLNQLRDDSQETVSLLVLEGRNVRFIDCVESLRSLRVGTRAGMVLPAHCTAGGKAILAALPATDLVRRLGDDDLERCTEASVPSWPELRRQLARVRRDGYAVNVGESEKGVSAVGVAVTDPIGLPVIAVALAVPTQRLRSAKDAAALAPMLLDARTRLSGLLQS